MSVPIYLVEEVVVDQLVERSFPIPEVRGSNSAIGKLLYRTLYCQLYWKDENKDIPRWPKIPIDLIHKFIEKKQPLWNNCQCHRYWVASNFYLTFMFCQLHEDIRIKMAAIPKGNVCTYHPADLCSSPKHNIYDKSFIVKVELHLSCEKNKNKQKDAGFGTFKKE